MGPLEFVVIGFEGNRFTGEIIPELRSLRERDLIRVLDLVFVSRDDSGDITTMELSDLPEDAEANLTVLDRDPGDWFAQDDIDQVAESLENDSSVAMVLFEHTWAVPLDRAVHRANGKLLAEGIVPRDVVAGVEELINARA